MTAIRSLEDLDRFREKVRQKKVQQATQSRVIVSMGSCGIAAGAAKTYQAIQEFIESESLQDVLLSQTGCNGLCRLEPIVQVASGSHGMVTYGKVTPEKARRIIREHVQGNLVVQEYLVED
jgi:NADP-reducing hydrogenase subunit HndB